MRVYTRLVPLAVPVLLLISLGVNVLQANRIETLLRPSAGGRLVGTVAAPIHGSDRNGAPVRVMFDGGIPTVLYYFSSRCGWCDRNWANVRTLTRESGGRFRFIALTSESDIASFLERLGLEGEVIQALDDDGRRAYGFAGTPHTVVVSAQGRISHEWVGAYQGEILRQVEELFSVPLPGLDP